MVPPEPELELGAPMIADIAWYVLTHSPGWLTTPHGAAVAAAVAVAVPALAW